MAMLNGISKLGLENKVIAGIVRWGLPIVIDIAILLGTCGLVLMIFFFTGLWIELGLGQAKVSHQVCFIGGYGGSLMITAFELHCWQIIEKHKSPTQAFKKEGLMIVLFALVWFLDAAASIGGFTSFITGHYYAHRLTPPDSNILFKYMAPVVVAFTVLNIPIIASIMDKVRKEDNISSKHRAAPTSFDS